jgi:16S rRNA processing protein RimM
MGRVLGPWGVRGWVKVAPYGDEPEGLAAQRTWWMQDAAGAWQPYAVSEARVHSGTVVGAIAGYATPEAAAALKGRDVAVPRSALPRLSKDEVYLADLVGLDVTSASGRPLGVVVAVEDFGAHPVLRVRPGGEKAEDRLVPFVSPILRSVDLAGRRITVDWEPEY